MHFSNPRVVMAFRVNGYLAQSRQSIRVHLCSSVVSQPFATHTHGHRQQKGPRERGPRPLRGPYVKSPIRRDGIATPPIHKRIDASPVSLLIAGATRDSSAIATRCRIVNV